MAPSGGPEFTSQQPHKELVQEFRHPGAAGKKKGSLGLLVSQSAESASSMTVKDTVLRAGKMV